VTTTECFLERMDDDGLLLVSPTASPSIRRHSSHRLIRDSRQRHRQSSYNHGFNFRERNQESDFTLTYPYAQSVPRAFDFPCWRRSRNRTWSISEGTIDLDSRCGSRFRPSSSDGDFLLAKKTVTISLRF